MKALAAFLLVLLILLAACFSYAHWKLYGHAFERDFQEQASRILRSKAGWEQVRVSFTGMDARLDGFVPMPSLAEEARLAIDHLPGARAVRSANHLHVPPTLRFELKPPGTPAGFQCTGWLPSANTLDRLNALLAAALPGQSADAAGIRLDAMVLEPLSFNNPAFPELIRVFLTSVSGGVLELDHQQLHMIGHVRSEAEKLRLQMLASKVMSGPNGQVVVNDLDFPATGVAKNQVQPWIGTSVQGLDLQRALRSFPIFFDSGSSVLKPEELGKVDQIVAAIRQWSPQGRYLVAGFSDPSGNAAANQKLSLKRAQAVVSQLVSRGLAASLFEVRASVENNKVPANTKNPDARRQSRRVEVFVNNK